MFSLTSVEIGRPESFCSPPRRCVFKPRLPPCKCTKRLDRSAPGCRQAIQTHIEDVFQECQIFRWCVKEDDSNSPVLTWISRQEKLSSRWTPARSHSQTPNHTDARGEMRQLKTNVSVVVNRTTTVWKGNKSHAHQHNGQRNCTHKPRAPPTSSSALPSKQANCATAFLSSALIPP